MIRLCLAISLLFSLCLPAMAEEKLTVLLEWFVNPDHAPLVIAREKGYFKDEGLDVDLVPASDPSAPPRLVAAGQADIALHYQPNLYLDRAAGMALKRFGTLIETPLNTVMVRADGPIHSLADLKGKKVGYSVAGFEDAMLGRMLASVGLTGKDVELINVNFALTASLLSGQVDATIGSFRNFELAQMKLEGKEGRAFYPEDHGVPAYDELIFVTSDERIGDPRLPRFLRAVERAAIFLTNHPDEAWDLFVKAYPDLKDDLNRQAFKDTLARFAKRPAALDRSRYARFSQMMVDVGLLKDALPVERVAVELP